jgi:acetoin utilization deacetylase AcuC-like enzyme
MTPTVALLTDAAMTDHAASGHPERPERLAAAAEGARIGATEAGARLVTPSVTEANDEELARIHDTEHIRRLEAFAADGGGWVDADTYVSAGSMRAARLAASATIAAARIAARGEADVAFAAVRPPGHHASADQAAGFCLLNSVALAVAALRAEGLARRIAIIDWDVHHGNGTQAIFDADADLCYTSTHQSPLYPGTGDERQVGRGAAAGTKHNRPMAPGSGDEELLAAWRDELLPAVERFQPDAILVSAGYDAHAADPLAHLSVTEDGYRELAALVGALAHRLGDRGVALTLEGGYDLDALRDSVAATVIGLLADRSPSAGGRP